MRSFKRVLITGIIFSEELFSRKTSNTQLSIHGRPRWHSTTTNNNLRKIQDKVAIYECDLCDLSSVTRNIKIQARSNI